MDSQTWINAILSTGVNLVLLVGVPLLGYIVYHKWRHSRSLREIRQRAGLQIGEKRYLGYALLISLGTMALYLLFPPPLEPLTREGSASRAFVGVDVATALPLALLYGVVKTGFSEEFLFRGLIAGSLGRRLSLPWANLLQAVIFLLPHLLLLFIMPELWWLMPIIFGFALVKGWLRIASGSILGPWLIHAALNVTSAVSVALRTGG